MTCSTSARSWAPRSCWPESRTQATRRRPTRCSPTGPDSRERPRLCVHGLAGVPSNAFPTHRPHPNGHGGHPSALQPRSGRRGPARACRPSGTPGCSARAGAVGDRDAAVSHAQAFSVERTTSAPSRAVAGVVGHRQLPQQRLCVQVLAHLHQPLADVRQRRGRPRQQHRSVGRKWPGGVESISALGVAPRFRAQSARHAMPRQSKPPGLERPPPR